MIEEKESVTDRKDTPLIRQALEEFYLQAVHDAAIMISRINGMQNGPIPWGCKNFYTSFMRLFDATKHDDDVQQQQPQLVHRIDAWFENIPSVKVTNLGPFKEGKKMFDEYSHVLFTTKLLSLKK